MTPAEKPGIFDGHFVRVDGLLIGGWRRTLSPRKVDVTATLLRRLGKAEALALERAAHAYLGLTLELSVAQPRRG